jgi:hypothetical protein
MLFYAISSMPSVTCKLFMLSVVKLSVGWPSKLIEGERSIKEKGRFDRWTEKGKLTDGWTDR